MNVQQTRIITTTGTKGKTSVTRALHYAIGSVHSEPVLGVDTNRVLLGSKKVSTFAESRRLTGLVPTVCPGRFLMALDGIEKPVAVLESSVGSSQSPGLGYRLHEIGIFTNVYDDHVGAKPYLATRADLARAKSFVFAHIQKGGAAIYCADNEYVIDQLGAVPANKDIAMIACTLNPEYRTDREEYIVTAANGVIIMRRGSETVMQVPIAGQPWLYGGQHEPSLYNALFVYSALWAFYRNDDNLFKQAVAALDTYEPDQDGGRMIVRTSKKGAHVLLDFAHEAVSLSHIAKYANSLAPKGKTIGVVRLSGERPNEHIVSTTQRFAPDFGELIIYEQESVKGRQPGEIAALMRDAAESVGIHTRVELSEESALRLANERSGADDSIVYIVGGTSGRYELADKIFEFTESN